MEEKKVQPPRPNVKPLPPKKAPPPSLKAKSTVLGEQEKINITETSEIQVEVESSDINQNLQKNEELNDVEITAENLEQVNEQDELSNQEDTKLSQEQETNKKVKINSKAKDKNLKKKQKKVNKKILILIFSITFVALAIAGAVTAFILINNKNNKKLPTPTLEVIQLYNGTVLKASDIANSTAYEFEIINNAGKVNTYKVSSSSLELYSYLNQGGAYSVRVRVYGKGAGATSNYSSKVNFTNYVQLKTPKVYINNLDEVIGKENAYKTNSNLTDDTITWDNITGADKYLVRYGADVSTDTIQSEEVLATGETITFNLSKIYAKGSGVYQISVVAVPSSSTYYLQSNYENIITLEYFAQQTPASNVVFNKTKKEITFSFVNGSNYGNELSLNISYTSNLGETSHKIYLNQCKKEIVGGKVNYTATLTQINTLNIFAMTLVTLSDGIYSTNSSPAVVTITQ